MLVVTEDRIRAAIVLNRQTGDSAREAVNLVNLAAIATTRGLADRARGFLRESIAIAERIGSKRAGIVQVECCLGLAALVGDWERAALMHGAAEALAEEMSQQREPMESLYLAPLIARTRDALGTEGFSAAERPGRRLSYEEAIAQARELVDESVGSDPIFL